MFILSKAHPKFLISFNITVDTVNISKKTYTNIIIVIEI